MPIGQSQKTETQDNQMSGALLEALRIISETCTGCKKCVKNCAFLKKYGPPKDIADAYNPRETLQQTMPFECSLCGLCAAVCPADINPAALFLEMRRETVSRGYGDYPEHAPVLGYEQRGTSKRYTYYALPEGCDTIFFPGCTLPATRPETTLKLYERMREEIPSLGIVLDCCTKPSHDLGRQKYFLAMFNEMKHFLVQHGIKNILVACPNCYKVFKTYGGEIAVATVYEFLAEHSPLISAQVSATVTIHDPCAVRFDASIHAAVRTLAAKQGLAIEEMPHHGTEALCCGEGGSVGFLSPDLARRWGALRKKEAGQRKVITYCAGCANSLDPHMTTMHILDVAFEPEATFAGKAKVSKAPFTYLNRLKLKRRLKKSVAAAVTRERTFVFDRERKKGGAIKRAIFLLLIIAAIMAVRFSGAIHYLERDALRASIQGYGALAPVLYMLLYAVAPALFLPGLPITIVGGILFGPFRGVVYTIISSTIGACVAFLVSRHIAREWIERKLRSPRWRRLDVGVEKHGWKIVAFTRLIPLFPFNLLNYAFGLTKIKFFHYAAATFIGMLPACIAFIVFSNSLLEAVRGRISPEFIIGLGLIILVSMVPVLYRCYKAREGQETLV